jgi:Flp pilus assembly protein CpaB
MSNTITTKVSGKVSSRGWAIALGLGAIVLATILLIVYLDRYRARVGGNNAPTPVLVANRTIPAGTPGTIVASQTMYAPTTLPKKEVEEGAIADPQFLTGRAAAAEILPGQQLTALDFAASSSTTVDSQIIGTQRAFSISLDAIHGSLGQLKAGDEVDVYIDYVRPGSNESVITLFRPAVKILAVPGPTAPAMMVRIDAADVADFMYATDHTRFYFALRPAAGAKKTPKDTASLNTLEQPPRARR